MSKAEAIKDLLGNGYLVIIDHDNTQFQICDLTGKYADCFQCNLYLTNDLGEEEVYEIDINKHDAVTIINGDY